jgi:hypothetical protein
MGVDFGFTAGFVVQDFLRDSSQSSKSWTMDKYRQKVAVLRVWLRKGLGVLHQRQKSKSLFGLGLDAGYGKDSLQDSPPGWEIVGKYKTPNDLRIWMNNR